MLGPMMMIREPIFQVYLLGMDEVGIRERPFGPKEELEEVEEPRTEEVSGVENVCLAVTGLCVRIPDDDDDDGVRSLNTGSGRGF